jgi:hypothetical protein
VFVTDYPKEVSPLARDHREVPETVERFEAIVAGRELANAFSELTDPDEQRRRFEDQARPEAAGDDEAMAVDEDYVRALEYGLPPRAGSGSAWTGSSCCLTDTHSIRDVVLFPTSGPSATDTVPWRRTPSQPTPGWRRATRTRSRPARPAPPGAPPPPCACRRQDAGKRDQRVGDRVLSGQGPPAGADLHRPGQDRRQRARRSG